MKEAAQAIANLVGYKGDINFVKPADPFSECLGLYQRMSAHKAKSLLGWQPKKPSFIDGVETYYSAWKAHI
jgi:nucleoside-diphosphate-sugar epimerase